MGTTLWMSGEVQSDIADEYRLARKDVEAAVNAALRPFNYGDGLNKWSVIAIILEEDHPDFDEVKKYRGKERTFEFRLKISHTAFKSADPVGRRRLIVEALLRSIAEMRILTIRSIDHAKLESDVRELAAAKGWL
jgi:hypothetical protein